MRPYIVVKDKLNIRNRTSLNDSSYVGNITRGELFWGNEQLTEGEIPVGSNNKYWVSDHNNRFVSYEGVKEYNLPEWYEDFGINKIWSVTRGKGACVIILDSGLTDNSFGITLDLTKSFSINNGKLSQEISDNTANQHGSKMAAIIGSNFGNYIGVAPECEIIIVKFTNKEINLKDNFEDYLLTLEYISKNNFNPIVVINNSLAFAGLTDSQVTRMESLISLLHSQNRIITVAIGNIFIRGVTHPAFFPNVISCSATQKFNGQYGTALVSPYWDGISVMAPGNFLSKNLGAGTSESCAFISGLIALYISYLRLIGVKNVTQSIIKDFIKNSTDNLVIHGLLPDGRSGQKNYKILKKELILNHFNL